MRARCKWAPSLRMAPLAARHGDHSAPYRLDDCGHAGIHRLHGGHACPWYHGEWHGWCDHCQHGWSHANALRFADLAVHDR